MPRVPGPRLSGGQGGDDKDTILGLASWLGLVVSAVVSALGVVGALLGTIFGAPTAASVAAWFAVGGSATYGALSALLLRGRR